MLLGACSSAIFSLFYCIIFLFTTDKRVLNSTSTFRNHIPHPASGTFDGCGKKFILEKTLERHIRRNHVPKVPIVTLYPADYQAWCRPKIGGFKNKPPGRFWAGLSTKSPGNSRLSGLRLRRANFIQYRGIAPATRCAAYNVYMIYSHFRLKSSSYTMSKSEVWKHFEISRDDAGCKLGICRLCSEKDTRLVLRCRKTLTN